MRDKRVVDAFAGAPQNYMMEVERRLSAAQADITTGAAGLASLTSTVTDLAATVDGLALNYAFGTLNSSFSTSSTSYVDISVNLAATITTTGGPLLVMIAGGSFTNADYQRTAFIAIQVNGTDYVVCDYMQDITASTDDIWVPLAGFYVVTGLPAGTYTVKGRAKSENTGTTLISGDSRVSLLALELAL